MILLCNCSLSLNVFNIGLQCNLRFLSIRVLQGSVATRVNDGGIFNDFFIANLLLSVMVKEFLKSVRIWQSYGKKIKWHLFSGHGIEACDQLVVLSLLVIAGYLLPRCMECRHGLAMIILSVCL